MSGTNRIDILETVLDDMLKLQKIIDDIRKECNERGKSVKGEKIGAAVTRRVEDMPGLIYASGFVPTVTFYMSKANDKIYRYFYNRFKDISVDFKALLGISSQANEKQKKKTIDSFYDTLCNEIGGKESAGYNLSLVLVASALEKLILVGSGSQLGSLLDLAKALQELRKSRKDTKASKLIANYMIEAKKLLRAFYGATEE